jgi:hypothetical protein
MCCVRVCKLPFSPHTSSLSRGALNRYSFVSCALAEWDWYGRNIAGDGGGGVLGIETGGFEVNGGI